MKKTAFFICLLIAAGAGLALRFGSHSINPAGNTVASRLVVPPGFQRLTGTSGSFAAYLQQLPLKADGSQVKTFDGRPSSNNYCAAAVLDIPVGSRDLLQCADAVMRLRADYLFQAKKSRQVSFNFVSGFKCDFASYAAGKRYANGKWQKTAAADSSYKSFLRYLDLVYSYASTLSLEKELKAVGNINEVQTGDVFIKGGSPGHCFIVLDMAVNAKTGEKVFALAQGFMPAQDIHIIKHSKGVWCRPGDNYASDFTYGELVSSKYHRRF